MIGAKVTEVAIGPLTTVTGPVQSANTVGSAQPDGCGKVHTDGLPMVKDWLAGQPVTTGPLTSRACTVMTQVVLFDGTAASVAV